ncbi:MAG: flagellar brake protein [Pseudomonadota bacterium]
MKNTEPPLKIELASLADDPRYQVTSAVEIANILRSMQQNRELVAAYFGSNHHFILTAILTVNAERKTLIIDASSDANLNRELATSLKIICVANHDKVRVQFKTGGVEEVMHDGRPAFRIRLPATMLKLQRREYYRLATPISTPVTCTISTPEGVRVTLNVHDISIGGISVLGYPTQIELEPGVIYEGCSINLPDAGTVIADLEIRNSFDITLKNNVTTRRSGCMFLNMPASAQTMIQKYIIKLERERRARLEGE